jgi:hypothetical protein
LPRESIAAWIRSVKEAILTQEQRERLQAKAAKHTLERFLQSRSVTGKGGTVKKASLWKAPFSAGYYAMHLRNRAQRQGVKSTRGRPGQQARFWAASNNPRRKSRKRLGSKADYKPLTDFGFQRVVKVSRCIQDPIRESEYSGTRVSTAP